MFRFGALPQVSLPLFVCLTGFGCDVGPATDGQRTGPRLAEFSNSGCLSRDDPLDAADETDEAADDYPFCGDQEVELTVDGDTLHVLHTNAVYNCCPDDIEVTMSIDGTTITLSEREITTVPCDCLCCFDVEATVADLPAGQYTVEHCGAEAPAGTTGCPTQTIVIP